MDHDSLPIEDAYIINLGNLSVYSSHRDGSFNIRAYPDDSLLIYHIAFLRKKVYATNVRLHHEIYLTPDTIKIKQIDVSPGPDKSTRALDKTIKSIMDADIIIYRRMNPEQNLVNSTMVENNSVLRSEASSISLTRFSPLKIINLVASKSGKKSGYNFYRNQRQKERKERKKNRGK